MSVNERILDLLRRYQELHEQGYSPTPEELCRDCPELLSEVQRRLDLIGAFASPPGGSTKLDNPLFPPAAASPPTASTTTPDMPPSGMRYRTLRLHARGGLGEVYLAHDEELHREVALKRIQAPCADDPDSRRRFLLEAEVTARLEHPGIVPVYGLVQDKAGQACYAMRFIEGGTLKQALEQFHQTDQPGRNLGERTLALRKLLGDFVAVCKAVGYAHSRGVVHRDLKPQNIMLGKYGEVLVVDWGLAKKVQRPEAERVGGEESVRPTVAENAGEGTRLGQALGTPAYMSPEQAAGRWDLLRPASDIYSLGATLYAVLTGRAPFHGTTPEILEQVQRGAFPPPRQVNPRVPPPLEAICLKAMALRPEERYGTALDPAEDVERWLAYEPVTAYREPWTARAGRWMRRRRTLVTGVGVALLVLLLSGGAAAWWYEHHRATHEAQEAAQTEILKQKVMSALNDTDKLVKHAETLTSNPSSWQAGLAAAKAALNHAEALLTQVPEKARGELAGQVRQVRTELEADEKDHLLVTAFEKVLFQLSEFNPRYKQTEAHQDVKRALAQWGLPLAAMPAERATALLQQRPQDMQPQLTAILHWCLQRVPAKEKEQQQWLAAVLKAADTSPWRQRVREAETTRNQKGLEQLVAQAEVVHQTAAFLSAISASPLLEGKPVRMALLRRAQQLHPQDFWVNFDLALCLCESVFPRGRAARTAYAEELPAVNEAIRFSTAALAVRPQSPGAHNNLGNALKARGDVDGAIACYTKALHLDPKDANAHTNLGSALQARGDVDGAIACYHKALELDAKFVPAHNDLGSALQARGDVKGAIACFNKALDLNPKDALAHYNLGVALDAQGDLKGAIACYHKALHLDPKYANAHTNLGSALRAQGDVKGAIACFKNALNFDPNLAPAHNNLGSALQAQGDVDRAIACYKKALDLDPNLAPAHNNLGSALEAKKDLAGAIACYKKALDLDPKYALAHTNLGLALADQGDLKRAIACYHKALHLDPKDATAHLGLGNALRAQRDLKGAIACYHKALELDPRFALAHHNLGAALQAQGDVGEAIACYAKAVQFDPKYALAHYNLGTALSAKKDLSGAIACYHKALELDPLYAEAHCNLGHTLRDQGKFAAALKALERGHQLGSKRPDWPYPSAQWVQDCQRLVDLDLRLPALLKGDTQPKGGADRLQLADFCRRYKKQYSAAVRFYQGAFAAQPKLTPQRQVFLRYNAACAAVLAAAGQGTDVAELDAKATTRLRQQALGWLRDNLQQYAKQLEDADAKTRQAVQQTLQHCQRDPDFDSVRGQEALAQLSETERTAWQQLWTDVAALLKKASASPMP
jgi:tetratricopeptide (TPR) repeat protein/tRNA A-37 threonylcarbamoyl transferase component Bud32